MSSDAIERRLSELRQTASEYATAYAHREYLDEFKKSKLAILMKQAEAEGFTTAAAQEREARAHPEYIGLLEGLRVATEQSEKLRWQLRIAEIGASLYQTAQANMRAERRGYG